MRRRTVSAPYRDFISELAQLKRLDQFNQARLTSSPTKPSTDAISRRQLHLLTEGIFFNAFRGFENYIEEIFVLYTQEKQTLNNKVVRSYLRPANFDHAKRLIQSSQSVLDWNSPDTVRERSELYLKDGFPVKDAYAANLFKLRSLRSIRNHIAHRSDVSRQKYLKVLRDELSTMPLQEPSPGEFLNMKPKGKPRTYFLAEYLDFFEEIAEKLVHP